MTFEQSYSRSVGAARGAFWAVVGAAVGFGLVGLLTIGILVLAGAAVMVILGLLRGWFGQTSPGLGLVGLGTAPLWLAWLNRSGPSDVCDTRAGVVTCVSESAPWPYMAVGIVLVLAGALWAFLARRR